MYSKPYQPYGFLRKSRTVFHTNFLFHFFWTCIYFHNYLCANISTHKNKLLTTCRKINMRKFFSVSARYQIRVKFSRNKVVCNKRVCLKFRKFYKKTPVLKQVFKQKAQNHNVDNYMESCNSNVCVHKVLSVVI